MSRALGTLAIGFIGYGLGGVFGVLTVGAVFRALLDGQPSVFVTAVILGVVAMLLIAFTRWLTEGDRT